MTRLRDIWRRRGTLRAQMSAGLALFAILVLFSGVFFVQQLFLLSGSIQVMQEETSRLAIVLNVPNQVVELQLLVLRGVAEQDSELFVAGVVAAVETLRVTRDDLESQLQTLAEGDEMRDWMAQAVVGVEDVINATEGILPLAAASDWSSVEVTARLLTLPRRQLQESVSRMVDLARERHLDANTQVRQALQRIGWISLPLVVVALVIGAAVIFRTIRNVSTRVELLGESARRLAEGRFDARAPISRGDELGQLAQSFNTMASELQGLYTGLERQVTERTIDLARRSTQLEAAAQVAREAAAIQDVNQLLDETVHLISDSFEFYHAGIFLLDEAGEYAVLRAASSEGGQRMLARGHRLQVGQIGIVGYVAGSGQPRVALDVGEDATYFDNPDMPNTRSEMALPLQVREEIIGVLDVQSTEAEAFTDEDIAVLQTMADQVAMAIRNARLLEESEDRLREISTLLRRYDREEWVRLMADRPVWRYVYDGVQVVPEEVSFAEDSTKFSLPLQVRDDVVGRLDLGLSDRSLSPDEVALAQAVVDQAGRALESARLFQETRRTLGEMEALYGASRRLTTASTVEEVASAITACVADTGADGCVVVQFEYSPRGEPVTLSYLETWRRDREPEFRSGLKLPIADSPFPFDMVSRFWTVPDVKTDKDLPESARRVFEATNVRALANIPLRSRDRVIGQVVVLRTEPGHFSSGAVRLYEVLSDQAAVALERARLLNQAQRRAEYQRNIAEITGQVRASTDVETILRTAVQELGRALHASDGLIRLDPASLASSFQPGMGDVDDDGADI